MRKIRKWKVEFEVEQESIEEFLLSDKELEKEICEKIEWLMVDIENKKFKIRRIE